MARPDNYIVALYVEVANIHLTIVGVVFATIWASEGRCADTNQLKAGKSVVRHSFGVYACFQDSSVAGRFWYL